MTALRTRKPTGLAPWPFVLVEGAEKTGKSYLPALLSADARIGTTYWLDCGEGAADQYGALPGVRYLVVEHDGSYRQLREAVNEIVKLPGHDEQGRPNVVVLDSATNLWSMLKAEANEAARKSNYGRKILSSDPDAEVPVSMDKWNRARDRWKGIVDPLIGWDGLVIFTARGKETTAIGDDGKPVTERGKVVKSYAIEAHKTLTFDVDVILRTSAPGTAMLTGARSAHDITGEIDQPRSSYSLAYLLFDVLRLGQAKAGVRELKVAPVETASNEVPAGHITAKEAFGQLAAAIGDIEKAKQTWTTLSAAGKLPAVGLVPESELTAVLAELAHRAAAEEPDGALGHWDVSSEQVA